MTQILDAVEARPGLRQADIARVLSITSAGVRPYLREMQEAGTLRRRDGGGFEVGSVD